MVFWWLNWKTTQYNPKPYQWRRRKNRWMKLEAFHERNNRAIHSLFSYQQHILFYVCMISLYYHSILIRCGRMTSTMSYIETNIKKTSKEDLRKKIKIKIFIFLCWFLSLFFLLFFYSLTCSGCISLFLSLDFKLDLWNKKKKFVPQNVLDVE